MNKETLPEINCNLYGSVDNIKPESNSKEENDTCNQDNEKKEKAKIQAYVFRKDAITNSGIILNNDPGKTLVENINVEPVDLEDVEENAIPKINIVLSTYYKGTALEGLTKKLEEYLDNAPEGENAINYL